MRFTVLGLLALVAASANALGTIVTDYSPGAARTFYGSPQTPLQATSARLTSQAILGQSVTADGWAFRGTVWALADSLPTSDPTQVPDGQVEFSSRLLEFHVQKALVPGGLLIDAGKQIIHPSSGFFRTPLNLISRGAAGNTPQSTPAASPQWEEGWWGLKVVDLVGDWTLEDFVSPPLTWSEGADRTLKYFSATQPALQNQFRVEGHWGDADVQALALIKTRTLGTSTPDVHAQGGVGLDTNVGDSWTVHAEATLSDSLDRLRVTDAGSLSTETQTLTWVPRALAGATCSITTDLQLSLEYSYDGRGFWGRDYDAVVRYARQRWSSGSSAPDVLGQNGALTAARNYGFARLADNLTNQLTAQGWAQVNLQDGSGMMGGGLASQNDQWGVSGSFTQTWGGPETEAHWLPFLWQLDAELEYFF